MEIKLSKGKLPNCSSSKLFNKLPGELVDEQSLQWLKIRLDTRGSNAPVPEVRGAEPSW